MHQQNTNAFGNDPNGFKAHLFAFFFGPTYVPDNYDHLLQRSARKALPPRFGPPGPHQIPWLPSGWTPTEPYYYYGVPCPPYLPAPLRFDASLFAALASTSRSRRSYDAWKSCPEEEIADGVFLITVSYRTQQAKGRFTVSTDVTWEEFYTQACVHLGIGPSEHGLAYREFCAADGAYKEYMDLSGCYGPLRHLRDEGDWANTLEEMREGGRRGLIVEMEVVILASEEIKGPKCKNLPTIRSRLPSPLLSNRALDILTYYFEYPSLEELLISLNAESEGPSTGTSWKDEDIQLILRSSGLQHLDDFTLVPPLAVYQFYKIPDKTVGRLYIAAEKMLLAFHKEKADEIAEIEGLVREWKALQEGRLGIEVTY